MNLDLILRIIIIAFDRIPKHAAENREQRGAEFVYFKNHSILYAIAEKIE